MFISDTRRITMKKIAFTLMFLSFTIGIVFTASAATPGDLMLYLPFDETTGDTAKDLSGNGYEAKLNEGAKFTNAGKVNGGAEMVGGRSHVAADNFNADPVAAANAITIGAWFKKMQHTDYDGVVGIELPDAGECCDFRLMVNPGQLPFWNMGHHQDRTGTFKFELGTWYHYAMTYDGAKAHIYVNGKEVDSSDEGINLPGGAGIFYVGTGESPGTWAMESGVIDEVFAFSRELSAAEIEKVVNEGVVSETAVGAKGKLATTWSRIKTAY
jgi:hypothetical protein